jgi:8-oxo-dGTP pyrophosphatase MutT (NUDIX family)
MFVKDQILKSIARHKRRVISSEEFPNFARAAVLVPLFPSNNELSVLLTVRTNDVETHKGQISFPGGTEDKRDGNAIQTALREAEEELGLVKEDVEILGILDDYPVPTRFIITPVIGYVPHQPKITINPVEVSETFEVPLAFFADRKNGRTEQREIRGMNLTVWYFQYGKHTIWGATAAILMNFIDILSTTK